MNEADTSLYCYLNGAPLSTGTTPVTAITADIVAPSEITFGGSTTLKPSEAQFVGYVREFRWWKNPRSQFEFLNFNQVGLTQISYFQTPNQLLAYWKLDESKINTKYTDFASGGTVTFDPTSANMTVT